MADLFYKLRDYYKGAFYIRDLNSFTYQTGKWSETGRSMWRYDPYLEKFINASNIFYEESSEETLYLTPACTLDPRFDLIFSQTLYDAVLKTNTDFLRPYCYIVTKVITEPYSTYNIHGYFGEGANLFCYKEPIRANNSSSLDNCCSCTIPNPCGNGPVWYDLHPMPKCTPTWSLSDGIEYFPHEFLEAIRKKCINTDEYFELIIFNFIHGKQMKIDRSLILDELDIDEKCFYYLPMIIFIISALYRGYLRSEKEFDM